MTAFLEHAGVDVDPPPTRLDDTLAAADEPTDSRGGGALVSPPGYDTPLPPDLALRVASAPVARHLASRLRAAGLCVTVSVAAAPEQDGGEMAHLLLVAGTPRRLEHAVRGWPPDPHSRRFSRPTQTPSLGSGLRLGLGFGFGSGLRPSLALRPGHARHGCSSLHRVRVRVRVRDRDEQP